MDIGTAKVSVGEREGVPHHGLDLVEPDEPFSVADYVRHVRGVLPSIAAQGGLAILVGGTGLYLRAVARGLDTDALPFDADVRAAIEAGLVRDGLRAAVARLTELAPTLASRIDLANPRRVARALEIAELRGDAPPPSPLGYDGPIRWLGLRLEAAVHREWIARRARDQFDAGLIQEARGLRERFDPSLPAFSAIGYAESWAVIDGTIDQETAIERLAQRTVAFSRRQATWFRSEPGIEWLDAAEGDHGTAVACARELLAGR
jgi:tRNA dimethylallyltransferase